MRERHGEAPASTCTRATSTSMRRRGEGSALPARWRQWPIVLLANIGAMCEDPALADRIAHDSSIQDFFRGYPEVLLLLANRMADTATETSEGVAQLLLDCVCNTGTVEFAALVALIRPQLQPSALQKLLGLDAYDEYMLHSLSWVPNAGLTRSGSRKKSWSHGFWEDPEAIPVLHTRAMRPVLKSTVIRSGARVLSEMELSQLLVIRDPSTHEYKASEAALEVLSAVRSSTPHLCEALAAAVRHDFLPTSVIDTFVQ